MIEIDYLVLNKKVKKYIRLRVGILIKNVLTFFMFLGILLTVFGKLASSKYYANKILYNISRVLYIADY